ncbi:McrB family protein, partial [Marinitoga litoralis]|uniref:McrB family protein n=1 Tax=Marinitoga litoralis TaxID=570855 RepID=UPI00196206E9
GVSTRQLIDGDLEYYRKLEKDGDSRGLSIVRMILEELNNDGLEDVKMLSNIKENNKLITEIANILKINKQLVLTGAPGTGKTYLAKEICKMLLAENIKKNGEEVSNIEINKYIKLVQFHPSYDYTDFVEGLRPIKKDNNIGFERKDGIFMEICKEAKDDKNNNYYLIIDEINRADLSKVFGELMYSLEYRGEEGKIKTQYNNLMEDKHPFKDGFYVPNNVFIIATMNDIDRSVEVFDFALRRRFFWYEIKANDVMEDFVKNMIKTSDLNLDNNIIQELIESAKRLNNAISEKGKIYGLNEHYHLGPAYFGKIDGIAKNENTEIYMNDIKCKIWKYRLEPILREYVRGFDNTEEFIFELREVFDNKCMNNNENHIEEN